METQNVRTDVDGDQIPLTVGLYKFFLAHGTDGFYALRLYQHLIFTARIQKETSVWANDAYLMKGTHMGRTHFAKAKKFLFEKQLIDCPTKPEQREDGTFKKPYICVHFSAGSAETLISSSPVVPEQHTGTGRTENRMRLPADKCSKKKDKYLGKEGGEEPPAPVAAPKESKEPDPDPPEKSDYRELHNRIKKAANMTGFSYNPTVAALYRKLDKLGILDEGELVALAGREDVNRRVSHWITGARDVIDDGGWPEGEPEQEEPKPRKLSERERLEREATLARLGYVKDKKTGQMVPQYEQEDTGKKKRCKCNTLHENVLFCIQGL